MRYGCVDGWSETSYFINSTTVTGERDYTTTPQEILDARVGYSTQKCATNKYYAKKYPTDDTFTRVSKKRFNKYLEDYQKACNGCLTDYVAGCC